MARIYEVVIDRLCISALNERLLIQVGVTPAETKALQKELHKLCMLIPVQNYLTNTNGYCRSDDGINLTRFLYILRCFCATRSRLNRISMKRHAILLKNQCLDNLFQHYASASSIEACMKQSRSRLHADIRMLVRQKM